MIGAVIGSFFGVAGFGGAIAGVIPGAIVGYLFASNLMKRDHADDGPTVNTERQSEAAPSPATTVATPLPTHSSHSGPAIEYFERPKSRLGGLWLFLGLVIAASAIWSILGIRTSQQPSAQPPHSALPQTPPPPARAAATGGTTTQAPRAQSPSPPVAKSSARSSPDIRSCLELRSNAAIANCAK
jgi:hypothetical protein